MSLNFSVAYNHSTKKVTCPRSSTVNQLASLAASKFGLPASSSGILIHNGKKLDGLLPLRLTNLVNNAKLSLEVSNELRDVTLKVVASVQGALKQKIVKTRTESTIQKLIDTFATETDTDLEGLRVHLSVLDAKIDNVSTDFSSMTLASILGSADNAVIRLNAESKDAQSKREKLEQEQSELRRQLEEKKRQARLLEKQKKEEEEEKLKKDRKVSDEAKGEEAIEERAGPTEPETNVKTSSEPPASSENDEMEVDETDNEKERTSFATAQPIQPPIKANERETEPQFEVKRHKEDTVYIPQSRPQVYENPESDYILTVAQAEKYYGIIKSMQQNKKPQPKDHTVPGSYTIRVRFPDRALLDLHIENSSMKLGQLLKKLDGFVHERHINSYRLKNGVPPFEEIVVGFEENNKELKLHKHFQHERIMLIWEPTEKSTKGPFLKLDVNTRSLDEMPTIQLESHRGQLEDETNQKSRSSSIGNNTEKSKKKGLPKWFKPNK